MTLFAAFGLLAGGFCIGWIARGLRIVTGGEP